MTFRLIFVAAALLVAASCGSSDDQASPSTTALAREATISPAPTTTTTAPSKVISVDFKQGKVITPDAKPKVKKGERVTIVVTSDVPDEIHLHGYDKTTNVVAGSSATIEFTADIAGGFEVELEKLSKRLVTIEVS